MWLTKHRASITRGNQRSAISDQRTVSKPGRRERQQRDAMNLLPRGRQEKGFSHLKRNRLAALGVLHPRYIERYRRSLHGIHEGLPRARDTRVSESRKSRAGSARVKRCIFPSAAYDLTYRQGSLSMAPSAIM